MDGQTILFKGKHFSKAYNLTYLQNNYKLIAESLQVVEETYFKFNDSRNSWIDYKKALTKPENKNLSYNDRIILGLKNDKLSPTLEEIPETEYTDISGFKYKIGKRDGLDSNSTVRLLSNILNSNITKKLIPADPKIENDCNKLIVNFRADVSNAIITFNGLFESYEFYKNSNTTVIFKEDPRELDDIDYTKGEELGLKFPRNEYDEIQVDWINIVPYTWKDIEFVEIFKSIRKEDEWIVFDKDVDNNCLLFYNKIMYFFEVNKLNPKYVRIIDVNMGNVNNFRNEDIKVVRFKDTNGEQLKQQRLVGFFNESEKTVYFPSNISNSIITYNGCIHEYIIKPDKKSIIFRIPADIHMNIDFGIDEGSRIYATNFYTGTLDGKSFYSLPNAELAKVANTILNEYKDKLDISENRVRHLESLIEQDGKEIIYSNYKDKLTEVKDIDNSMYQVFYLKFRPIPDTLILYINGVAYEKDIYFTYDKDNKKLIWTFNKNSNANGFTIESDFNIYAQYDIYYADNSDVISDPKAFREANS